MEMNGERFIQAPMDSVWSALNDPDVLRMCLPGCEKVERSGENQYVVAMNVKLGPVGARFTGRITLSDLVPPTSYKLAFEGNGGAAGFGKGTSAVTLAPFNGGCQLAYAVQSQVAGKIAQLGQRLIDSAAKSMADDFFKRFDHEVQARHVPAATRESAAPIAASVRSPAPPTWMKVVAGLVLAALAWLVLRG